MSRSETHGQAGWSTSTRREKNNTTPSHKPTQNQQPSLCITSTIVQQQQHHRTLTTRGWISPTSNTTISNERQEKMTEPKQEKKKKKGQHVEKTKTSRVDCLAFKRLYLAPCFARTRRRKQISARSTRHIKNMKYRFHTYCILRSTFDQKYSNNKKSPTNSAVKQTKNRQPPFLFHKKSNKIRGSFSTS